MIEIRTQTLTTVKEIVFWEHFILMADNGEKCCSSCPFVKEHLIFERGSAQRYVRKCGWDGNECVFLGEKCYLKTHAEAK